MDLVVGGRLGTGVKKGFLIGGAQKGIDEVDSEGTSLIDGKIKQTKDVEPFASFIPHIPAHSRLKARPRGVLRLGPKY
jgi:hypothetical protein